MGGRSRVVSAIDERSCYGDFVVDPGADTQRDLWVTERRYRGGTTPIDVPRHTVRKASLNRSLTYAKEVFIYRLPPTGRSRTLVDNITPASDLGAVLRQHGVGRYRLEWRDRKRAIMRVRLAIVRADGSTDWALPKGRPRRVPPPRTVPLPLPQPPPVSPGGAPKR